MAYFNHAFCKSFLVTEIAGSAIATQTLTAGQLGAADGSWGALDPTTFPTAAIPKNMFYLAQGSFHPNDKIGTHGGYQESVKSKGINPRYITRLWSSVCQDSVASTVTINVDETCAPCGDAFFLRVDVKGSPALRFLNHNVYAIGDSGGSAALNNTLPGICCIEGQEYLDPAVALAKAAGMLLEEPIISPFIQEQQWGGAAAGITVITTAGLDGVDTTSTLGAGGTDYTVGDIVTVDTGTSLAIVRVVTIGGGGAVVTFTVLAAGSGYTVGAKATTNVSVVDPTATGFTVTVVLTTDGSGTFSISEMLDGTYTPSTDPVADGVTATMTFVGAYADTQFGDCSFDTRDHYEMEPVQIYASILDETGDPCNQCGSTTRTDGVMAQTHGETVLRDILLHERYLQSPYHQGAIDSPRIREIEGFEAIKAAVTRGALYKVYYLQHSIPRLSNPSGTFDNDQYIYQFFVECLVGGVVNPVIAEMDTLFTAIATLCATPYGNPVTFDPLGIDQL